MVTEEQIKEMAYSIWEKEGCPEGKDLEHYFRAKQILETGKASQSSGISVIKSSPKEAKIKKGWGRTTPLRG